MVDDCHACVSKPGCVWVEAGTMNSTSKLPGAFSITRAHSWDGVCWSGGIFNGATNVADAAVPSGAYRLATTRKADEWYWGQCALKNHSLGSTLLVMLLGGTLGLALLFRAFGAGATGGEPQDSEAPGGNAAQY